MQAMKITFVRPSMMSGTPQDVMEPLVFAILSGLTPRDVERVLYDQRIESIPFDEPTDLAVLTVETFTAKSAYQIAAHFHRRGIPVVMGGHHPTLQLDEALKFADSVVVGDAEGVWADLIEDARHKLLKPVYQKKYPPLSGLRPDRSIFKGKRYQPMALVQFSRGCRFACDFCSVHAFYGKNISHHPVGEVVDEIKKLGRRYVFIVDDNLFADVDAAAELLRALEPLHIRWACQTSLDVAGDRELVRLMAESGCVSVTIGFESLIADNIRQMGKSWNLAHGPYDKLVKVFYEQGIMIYGTFVFGYDHDTADSFRMSLEFALRHKFLTANFNPLAPTPGTPLYERLHQEGRLINDPWWLNPEFRYGQSWLQPKLMTADELAEGCLWARTQFNTYSNIFKRALNFSANCRSFGNFGAYMAVNWVTRREIQRKQGRPLGDTGQPGLSF